ncbi:MAG TPA: hypothetical protein VFF73_40055 [Planctomycetota bacterium]|nr:hypothetical protein [Planctomycetota bacterium]
MPDPSDDEKLLESMGYTQELARNMSGFSNFALSFSIICILTLYSAAFTVLVAGSAVFLYISYIMPVTAGLFAEGRTWTRKGPFDLGGFSRPMAVAATLGGAVLVFVGVQPPNEKVLYLALGLLVVMAVFWWGAGERRRFRGPPVI